jgi:hypothetical protein
MILYLIPALFFLGMIAYEDFKYRAISWWWLPLLAAALAIPALNHIQGKTLLSYFIMNASFIAIQFIILTLYFSLKNRRLINIFNHHLGIGDILFFIIIGLFFAPILYITFFIVGLFVTLIGFLVWKSTTKKTATIPLAGALALCLCIAILYNTMVMAHYGFYQSEIITVKMIQFIHG